MKVNWKYTSTEPVSQDNLSPKHRSITITEIKVGHTSSEMYIRLGETAVIMMPAVIKKMTADLRKAVVEYEEEFGVIKLPKKPQIKKRGSTAQKVAKALFKSKKIGPKLISINTRKRKHLPFKND